jgi:pilus assembly protein Flp/PilA
MLFSKRVFNEEGQGLVEYALILVLVAIVVIAVLLQLGPVVSDVYAEVASALGYSNITNVSAERLGNGNANDVDVTITVSTNTTVTIEDSQDATTLANQPCTGSCTYTLTGVGAQAGTVTVTDEIGGRRSVSYPVQHTP